MNFICAQVLQPLEELFEFDELSGAREQAWPDYFSAGLFVFRPSLNKFFTLHARAELEGSYDGTEC